MYLYFNLLLFVKYISKMIMELSAKYKFWKLSIVVHSPHILHTEFCDLDDDGNGNVTKQNV